MAEYTLKYLSLIHISELVPQLHIDCMVQSEWLTQENIESLSVLEPYGMKNAEPVFCMKNMTVEEITPLSSDRHVRLSLIKDCLLYTSQLCTELREFFPENAVEYFVSYYDYYQPEAYIASTAVSYTHLPPF